MNAFWIESIEREATDTLRLGKARAGKFGGMTLTALDIRTESGSDRIGDVANQQKEFESPLALDKIYEAGRYRSRF